MREIWGNSSNHNLDFLNPPPELIFTCLPQKGISRLETGPLDLWLRSNKLCMHVPMHEQEMNHEQSFQSMFLEQDMEANAFHHVRLHCRTAGGYRMHV
jgi:hypothetical protein